MGVGIKDLRELFEWAERLLGVEVPVVFEVVLGALLLVAFILSIIAVIAVAAAKTREVWADRLRPKSYSPEQRQKVVLRRRFAEYLTDEISKKNKAENWRDDQYAELEAEVEAEGARFRAFWQLPKANAIRRERSLSIALGRSRERLILVEGDPGSGKSVALRHVALDLARCAQRSKRLDSRLPVYVNLKELKRADYAAIDRQLIRDHVLKTLRRINDRFVDEFIEEGFDEGVRDGSWVFLFDSFDELPEVLGATEVDQTTAAYTQAISDFLGGINRCRGILASRHYRGPKTVSWSTFRVLPLNVGRQHDLIRKSLVAKPHLVRQLQTDIALAGDDMKSLAQNPMLLGLLCEHMRLSGSFPKNSYELMSAYVSYRMTRDQGRVQLRYGLGVDAVNDIAEVAAFVMTDNPSLGLSPGLIDLESTILAADGHKQEVVRRALNALVYMRLARSDGEEEDDTREFTYSHRRFQEYFATKMLLRGHRAVSPERLLHDARWRETAVVILQLGGPEMTRPLLEQASAFVSKAAHSLAGPWGNSADAAEGWEWPTNVLHTLSILQAGTTYTPDLLSNTMRADIAEILNAAMNRGDLLDSKLALQVAGTLPEDDLVSAMKVALSANSRWLNDAVYWQASRLSRPDPAINKAIRRSMQRSGMGGAIRGTYAATRAYVSRLPQASLLLEALRLAYWAPRIDQLLFVALAVTCAIMPGASMALVVAATLVFVTDLYFAGRAAQQGIQYRERGLARVAVAGLLLLASFDVSWSALLQAQAAPVPLTADDYIAPLTAALSREFKDNMVLAVILIWWMLWFPAAVFCIIEGVLLKTTLWPFTPAGPPVVGARAAMRDFDWSKVRVPRLKELMAAVLVLGLIAASLGVVWGLLYLITTVRILSWILGVPFGIIFGAAMLVSIVGVLSHLGKKWKDRWEFGRIREGDLEPPGKLEEMLRRARTRRGRNLILRHLLKSSLPGGATHWTPRLRAILEGDDKLRPLMKLFPPAAPAVSIAAAATPVRRHRIFGAAAILMEADEATQVREERDLLFQLMERASRLS